MGTLVWESRTPAVGNNRSLHWMSGVSNTVWEQYVSPSNGALPLERQFVYCRTKQNWNPIVFQRIESRDSSDGNKNKVKHDEFVGWKICGSEIRCFQGKMSLPHVPNNRYMGSSYNLLTNSRTAVYNSWTRLVHRDFSLHNLHRGRLLSCTTDNKEGKLKAEFVASSWMRGTLPPLPYLFFQQSIKGPIQSQLNWAILLCDVIPDGKLSKLRSFDRQ